MAGKWTLILAMVVLGNSTVFGGGVKCLRDMGPRGLEVALAEFHKAQAKLASATNAKETGALRAEMERWRETVDQVAGQKHATVSRLYWCTDPLVRASCRDDRLSCLRQQTKRTRRNRLRTGRSA